MRPLLSDTKFLRTVFSETDHPTPHGPQHLHHSRHTHERSRNVSASESRTSVRGQQQSLRTTHVSPSVPRPMRGPLRRRFRYYRGPTVQATCWPRAFSVFASQCRAGLTRLGNRVSVMISHARMLHLRHLMRGSARSWTSHIVASASIQPCMSFCMDSTLKTLSDRITTKSCRVHVSPRHVTFQHSSMAFMSRQGRN